MGEARGQRKLRCQINYLPDRHVLQKMSEVYRRLVPESEAGENPSRSSRLATITGEKDRSHLRSSFF